MAKIETIYEDIIRFIKILEIIVLQYRRNENNPRLYEADRRYWSGMVNATLATIRDLKDILGIVYGE